MFTQFFNDWNEAVKNENIIKTQYNDKGEVLWQRGTVTFRGTEIQTHRKSDGHGGYHVELFVPKTNKFISNKRFPTKAKCAEAILLALLPGTEKEELRNQRAERKAAVLRKKITGERIESLRKLNMKKEDFAWFCELMNRNLQAGNSFYDDVLVDVLSKFHRELCCDKSILDQLPERDRASPDPSFRLPAGVVAAKSVFRNIDAFLHNDTKKLTYICSVLQDFYQSKTDKTPEQIIATADERKKRAKERKLRRLEGLNNDGTYTVLGSTQPMQQEQKTTQPKPQKQNRQPKQKRSQQQDTFLDSRPGMVSLGNVIGDQLSGLELSEEPQDNAE